MCLAKCLTATLSLVLPLPFHPLPNWQRVRTRRLKGLSLQVGIFIVKQLENQTGAPGEARFIEFKKPFIFTVCPSSRFPVHVIAVVIFPSTWRVGTHGMGATHYCFKGSAFAHPISPILSVPSVQPYAISSCHCRQGHSRFHQRP